jgi:hypothetical protein
MRNLAKRFAEFAAQAEGHQVQPTAELVVEIVQCGPVDRLGRFKEVQNAHVAKGIRRKIRSLRSSRTKQCHGDEGDQSNNDRQAPVRGLRGPFVHGRIYLAGRRLVKVEIGRIQRGSFEYYFILDAPGGIYNTEKGKVLVASVFNVLLRVRGNVDGITRTDFSRLTVDEHLPLPGYNVIDFVGGEAMSLGPFAWRHGGVSE